MSKVSTNVTLHHQPRNGIEAYHMLLQSITSEISEKQEVLAELMTETTKLQFINNWTPDVRNININYL